MKINLILAIFVCNTIVCMGQEYKVMRRSEANQYGIHIGVAKFWQNAINLSLVHELKNGTIIVIPAAGDNCLLFENKKSFENTLKDSVIPLSSINPIEKNQDIILGMPANIDSIIGDLGQKLIFKLEFENTDSSYLDHSQEVYFPLARCVQISIRKE